MGSDCNKSKQQENDRRLNAIIDASPVPLALGEEDGKTLYLNPCFTDTFGYTLDDIPHIDEWWLKAYPDPVYREEAKSLLLERIRQTDQHHSPFIPMELRIRCKNGELRTVCASMSRLKGNSKQLRLFSLSDVTLIKSVTERLQTLLANASDGIHILDKQGNIVEFSESFSRMLGYTREETSQLNISDWDALISGNDFLSYIQKLMDSNGTFDTRYRRKDGELIDVEIHAKWIVFDGQQLLYAASRNITKRKRAEEQLKQAMLEQSAILENANVGITLIKNRIQVKSNRKMAEIFGYELEEMTNTSTRKLYISQQEFESLGRKMYPVIFGGGVYTSEREMCRKDGSLIWVRIYGKAIDIEAPESGSILVFEDISDAKAKEQALHKAKALAEQASNLKSEFLANMSHEIRTPMNAILGLSQIILDTELNTLQRDYMEKLHKSAESLLGIINDILDYSKIEAGKLNIEATEFRLFELLDATAGLFSYTAAEKGLELIFDIDLDLPPLLIGDPLRLRQILNNLLGNAVKFTRRGSVTLGMKRQDRKDRQFHLQACVTDTGIGMTPDQIDRIFTPFEQAESSTTRRFGGTGLGLSISRRLVELMGGEISVQSQPDVGTAFTFSIPLGISDSPTPGYSRAVGLSPVRTLIVEDDTASRNILAGIFNSWGFDAELASTAEQGLNMALSAMDEGRPFRQIIVDWRLPGMDGIALARRLRDAESLNKNNGYRHAVIIMVTAYGRRAALEASHEIKIDAILDKPVIASQLYNICIGLQGAGLDSKSDPSWSSGLLNIRNQLNSIHGARILLVEDNPTNQLIAGDILKKMGLAVDLADNGLEGVSKASSTVYDAILMDLQMPELDGVQATRRIRQFQNGKAVPIIAMTAAAMAADKTACFDAGMDDFVSKPIDINLLAAALLRWIPPRIQETEDRLNPVVNALNISGNGKPFSVKGLNLSHAAGRMGNDWALLRQALRSFVNDFKGFTEQFEACLTHSRRDDALRMVHTIKGASKLIGADNLSETSATLEHELKREQCGSWQEMRRMLAEVLDAIAAVPETQGDISGSLDIARFRELARRIFSDLSNSRFVPPESVKDICSQLAGAGYCDQSEAFKRHIDAFNYPEACDILTDISAALQFEIKETDA